MPKEPRDPEVLERGDPADDVRLLRGIVPILLFAGVAVTLALDVGSDLREGSSWGHVAIEIGAMALALFGAGLLVRELARVRRRARRLEVDLAATRAQAARWREDAREALKGLAEAIDRQFDRWGLTAAEREVGLLLLKGLSLREVAEVRGTSERTAREQSRSVYRKAGLSGRAELSAFFLEDLLLPPPAGGAG